MKSNMNLANQVQHTQQLIRKQLLQSVFNEFDGNLMQLDTEKRKQKYAKMAQSPFSFYRGSAYLFYFDVSREWFPFHSSPEKPTWIQGDLHFENFGAFRSEHGRFVFDVNDFDEGYVGSYLFDLLRMTVSIALVCRMQQYELSDIKKAIDQYLEAYYKQMVRFANRKDDPQTLVFDKQHTEGPIRKLLKKTEKRSAEQFVLGLTTSDEVERRFVHTEEIVAPTEEERALIEAAWPDYLESLKPELRGPDSFYKIKDIAIKHGSGTASIGLDRFYLLVEGDAAHDLILEVKEVRTPIPAYYFPYHEPFWSSFGHQGKRVITTQQAMHHEADPHLGYLTLGDRHFYVRERSPYKKKLKAHKLESMDQMLQALATMGRITGKLHARADADMALELITYHSEDEIVRAMGEDMEAFCDYVANWGISYMHQVEEDYRLFSEVDFCSNQHIYLSTAVPLF